MKVLAVLHGYLPNLAAGSERMVQHMLAPLVADGHDVELWSLMDEPGEWMIDGVRCRGGRPDHRSVKPDIILTHHDFGSRYAAFIAAMHPQAKRVAVYHNERYFIESLLAFRPDLHVFNTKWVCDAVNEKFGPLSGDQLVVHPPLEPARHYVDTRANNVTLINLQENKGVGLFGELIARMPDVNFLGVQGTHGIQDYPSGRNVTFLPTQQDMRKVWELTGVLLMPSAYESYGMCAAEACVSGIPVIAHPTPGLRECLGDGGIFLDRSNVDDWVTAIRDLLETPGRYREASDAATMRAKQLLEQTEFELACWKDTIEGLVR